MELNLNSLDLIRIDTSNGLDTKVDKLIIVYGIQRTDVKNCFYERVSCDPMDRDWGGENSPVTWCT